MGAMKKGPTKGSGGKHRNALKGKGPTPKAEDRVYHKAYKAKKAADRRKMADSTTGRTPSSGEVHVGIRRSGHRS